MKIQISILSTMITLLSLAVPSFGDSLYDGIKLNKSLAESCNKKRAKDPGQYRYLNTSTCVVLMSLGRLYKNDVLPLHEMNYLNDYLKYLTLQRQISPAEGDRRFNIFARQVYVAIEQKSYEPMLEAMKTLPTDFNLLKDVDAMERDYQMLGKSYDFSRLRSLVLQLGGVTSEETVEWIEDTGEKLNDFSADNHDLANAKSRSENSGEARILETDSVARRANKHWQNWMTRLQKRTDARDLADLDSEIAAQTEFLEQAVTEGTKSTVELAPRLTREVKDFNFMKPCFVE